MRKLLLKKSKLQNNNGASLFIALLLFAVCAVVGTVLLISATTSSGRFSSLAELDRKYYSVNSATDFLVDLIEEKEITIERSKIDASGSITYMTKLDGSVLNSAPSDYLSRQAVKLLFGEGFSGFDTQEAYDATFGNFVDYATENMNLTFSGGGNNDIVVVKSTLKANGDLLLEVSSSNPNDTGIYTLNVYFSFVPTNSEYSTKAEVGSQTTIDTKETICHWRVDKIEKAVN